MTGKILKTVYERGRVWISEVTLSKQERALRACITSLHTSESDIDCLWKETRYARQTALSQRLGKALRYLHRDAEALDAYEQVIKLNQDLSDA